MIGPLGMQEMLIIMGVALIVFGPRKLPQIGKTLGRSLAEFRRTSSELRSTLEREVEMEEFRSAREEISGAGDDLRAGLDPDRGAPRRTPPSGPAGAGAGSAKGPPNPAGPVPAENAGTPAPGAGADPGSSGPGETKSAAGDDGEAEAAPEGPDAGAAEEPDGERHGEQHGEQHGEAAAEEGTPSR